LEEPQAPFPNQTFTFLHGKDMLIGLTLLVVGFSLVIHKNPQLWAMFLSWLRRADPSADNGAIFLNVGGSTPKAKPQSPVPAIPQISLEDKGEDSDSEDEENLPPPQFPALNSAQRVSASRPIASQPTLLATASQPSSTGLMAPPPRMSPSQRASLPNRSPASSSGLRPLVSTPAVPNPERKSCSHQVTPLWIGQTYSDRQQTCQVCLAFFA